MTIQDSPILGYHNVHNICVFLASLAIRMFVDQQAATGPSSASVMGSSPIAYELMCFGFLVARFGSRALQIEAACEEGLRLYSILSSQAGGNTNMRAQSCDLT